MCMEFAHRRQEFQVTYVFCLILIKSVFPLKLTIDSWFNQYFGHLQCVKEKFVLKACSKILKIHVKLDHLDPNFPFLGLF